MAGEMVEASAPKRRGRKKLRSIEIEKAKNGGHTVTHNYEMGPMSMGGSPHMPENHVFGQGDGEALIAHIRKHMNIGEAAEPGGEAKTDTHGGGASTTAHNENEEMGEAEA